MRQSEILKSRKGLPRERKELNCFVWVEYGTHCRNWMKAEVIPIQIGYHSGNNITGLADEGETSVHVLVQSGDGHVFMCYPRPPHIHQSISDFCFVSC